MRNPNDTMVWIAFLVFALFAVPAVAEKSVSRRPLPGITIPGAIEGGVCEREIPVDSRTSF
jgi:hypothetical protein